MNFLWNLFGYGTDSINIDVIIAKHSNKRGVFKEVAASLLPTESVSLPGDVVHFIFKDAIDSVSEIALGWIDETDWTQTEYEKNIVGRLVNIGQISCNSSLKGLADACYVMWRSLEMSNPNEANLELMCRVMIKCIELWSKSMRDYKEMRGGWNEEIVNKEVERFDVLDIKCSKDFEEKRRVIGQSLMMRVPCK